MSSREAEMRLGCWMFKPKSKSSSHNVFAVALASVTKRWQRRWVFTSPNALFYASKQTVNAENTVLFSSVIDARCVDVRIMRSEGAPTDVEQFGWLLKTKEKDILFAASDLATRDRFVKFFGMLKRFTNGTTSVTAGEVETLRLGLSDGGGAPPSFRSPPPRTGGGGGDASDERASVMFPDTQSSVAFDEDDDDAGLRYDLGGEEEGDGVDDYDGNTLDDPFAGDEDYGDDGAPPPSSDSRRRQRASGTATAAAAPQQPSSSATRRSAAAAAAAPASLSNEFDTVDDAEEVRTSSLHLATFGRRQQPQAAAAAAAAAYDDDDDDAAAAEEFDRLASEAEARRRRQPPRRSPPSSLSPSSSSQQLGRQRGTTITAVGTLGATRRALEQRMAERERRKRQEALQRVRHRASSLMIASPSPSTSATTLRSRSTGNKSAAAAAVAAEDDEARDGRLAIEDLRRRELACPDIGTGVAADEFTLSLPVTSFAVMQSFFNAIRLDRAERLQGCAVGTMEGLLLRGIGEPASSSGGVTIAKAATLLRRAMRMHDGDEPTSVVIERDDGGVISIGLDFGHYVLLTVNS